MLLIGLVLLASLSPLCTAAALWQMKEWRWDRLLEHLRREGILRQLFGWLRPAVAAAFAWIFLLRLLPLEHWVLLFLTTLAGLSIIQFGLRKQRLPILTRKAVVLVATSVLLTAIAAFVLTLHLNRLGANVLLPFLPLLQPFFVMLSWLLWRPVDFILKKRVLDRAQDLRALENNLTVIGITGSVGKTTTKEILAHVLAELPAIATPAYVNSEMGVAHWLIETFSKPDHPKTLIIEMGAYREGEIALLSAIAKQTIGVVTYVGSQHLALFGSEEALVRTKAEIITHLPQDGHAFLNGDNDAARKMKELSPCPVTIVGTGGSCDIEAFDVEETPTGIRFRVEGRTFSLPFHGTHNVTNVLLAIAVARHLGMTDDAIAARLKTFIPPQHTFSVRAERNVTILDDTHNSSAASFRAAIAWARTQPFEAKTLLASGLIELGDQYEPIHRELGALATHVFSRVIFLDEESAKMFQQGFGKPVEVLRKQVLRVSSGSLLVCIGRMRPSTINRLLPSEIVATEKREMTS
ncbi:UDP-N-acetylmuramoyl-tripeptide--D-alanyl-D-alanine ligase [Candidatus Peregrinibacteria bacterium]|nr:UDP-N-acetylmuramoyl-tripeptide--D-alanyl-D-alanine ligase [Candidatus Peregrinibacteria bacterium]